MLERQLQDCAPLTEITPKGRAGPSLNGSLGVWETEHAIDTTVKATKSIEALPKTPERPAIWWETNDSTQL